MQIFLSSKIFNNTELMAAIEKEFGGITQDTPDFFESEHEEPNVWSNDEWNLDVLAYVQSINSFIEKSTHG